MSFMLKAVVKLFRYPPLHTEQYTCRAGVSTVIALQQIVIRLEKPISQRKVLDVEGAFGNTCFAAIIIACRERWTCRHLLQLNWVHAQGSNNTLTFITKRMHSQSGKRMSSGSCLIICTIESGCKQTSTRTSEGFCSIGYNDDITIKLQVPLITTIRERMQWFSNAAFDWATSRMLH